jgi:ribosome assembly protein 1
VAENRGIEAGETLPLQEFRKQLRKAFLEGKGDRDVWNDVVDKIAAFGPKRVGPNVLIDSTSDGTCGKV